MSRPKLKIRRDDTVIVLAGKDKGSVGRVLRVFPEKRKLLVEDVNRVTRHQKPVGDQPGSIIQKEMPVDLSNVALYDDDAKCRIKVSFRDVDGAKVRVNRKTGDPIDKGPAEVADA